MFEAVFILTTIDSGTRIGRFVLQEFGGRVWKPFGRADFLPASLGATIVIVLAWGYFIWVGDVSTVWPMFGVANQLLGVVALAVATTLVINIGRAKYAWVTAVPCLFISVTTLSAGYLNIVDNFWPMAVSPDPSVHVQGYVNSICTVIMMTCAVVILSATARRCFAVAKGRVPLLDPVEA